MKKYLSIALLFVFLFNVGGYYLLLQGLRYSAYKELTEKIEQENYRADDSDEIKLLLTLPYPIHENNARTYDEFEHNGEYYVLAEQKLDNDTLYIKTVRNSKKTRIDNAFEEYAKSSNDFPSSKQKESRSLLAKLMKEYKRSSAPGAIARQNGLLWQFDFPLFSGKRHYEEHIGSTFHPPRNLSFNS